jgi:hypothetical protein
MSLQGIEQVLERGAREPDFSSKIKADPSVLDEYDLTEDERTALLTGNQEQLEALGMEDRVTKTLFRGKTWA